MSTHPITGKSIVSVAGVERRLAFDMNCAAALHESVGEHWNTWLVARFLGEKVKGEDKRRVTPLTPGDSIIALHALLATDREDHGVLETVATLRRTLTPPALPQLQMAMLKVVLAGFGLPGEAVAALINAEETSPASPARGTGKRHSGSPTVRYR